MMITCRICNTPKEESEFYVRRDNGKPDTRCKACVSKHNYQNVKAARQKKREASGEVVKPKPVQKPAIQKPVAVVQPPPPVLPAPVIITPKPEAKPPDFSSVIDDGAVLFDYETFFKEQKF